MQQRSASAKPALTDRDLVAAAKAGNGAALGLLLERHRPHLLATALRILVYRPDAEDAVQETCLAAMRYLGSVRDPDAAGAWLTAVLRRACLQHQRRRGNGEVLTDSFPDLLDERPGPEERIERLELRDWIWGALQRLPEPLRVSAILRYFGSYASYDEVAAILGVPIGTVRSRLSEVKARLADALLASAGLIDDDARVRARARTVLDARVSRCLQAWPKRTVRIALHSRSPHRLVGWEAGPRSRASRCRGRWRPRGGRSHRPRARAGERWHCRD